MKPMTLAALATLMGPAAAAAAPPASLSIELTNFRFSPSAILLHANAPVTLHLVNASGGGHSFSAPRFFSAARIEPASAPLVRNGRVEVPAHAAVDISLTPAAGNYPLKCSHMFHSAFGMKGRIIVQ